MRWVIAAVAAAAFLSLAPATARAEIVITISKSQQRIAVAVDGAERFRWPVSTGLRRYETPVGKFRPVRFERDWYSRKYNWAPMPHSIFFYKGYAMHGTTEERNLGRRASHGCVRLSRENAATLFAMVRARGRQNARIVVVNGPLPKLQDSPDANIAALEQPADPAEALARATDDDTIQVTVTPDVLPLARPAVLKVAAASADVPMPIPAPTPVPVTAPAIAPVHAPVAIPPIRPAYVAARPVRTAPIQKFTSVGSEAEVLRGREAWLRSLDRKYGILR
jgi:hypothetical protein